jgi:dTDP-4-dehydrorhamnose reductase
MRILVTGATGQLGVVIAKRFERDHTVVRVGHDALDITNPGNVADTVRDERPDVIINCAAYNNVDAAQDDPVTPLEVNAFGVEWLARAATECPALLVHYSSDFVFSGDADRPYTEEMTPDPRSSYAMSKLLGEWFARDAPRSYVLRVESLFGGSPASNRKSSVDHIADAILEGREAVVFSDRTVSPSFVDDVAAATKRLVEGNAPLGLYHCVNSGHGTWLDLGREIARQLGVVPKLVPRRMAEIELRAPRPRYCALSNAKLAGAGIEMPTWQDALGRYLRVRVKPQSPEPRA